MGIAGLWDLIGDGDLVQLAQLSANCWEKEKRPFRIAVDEAGWRFNNLNDFQVAQIRAREPAANPIEKAIFYRITKLLKLNIELIFVFDGPKRPWKRGRSGGNRVNWERIKLLKDLLKSLGVPYHHAPGEAEAECARLQELGIVDAVWSDDGDTLMFGCNTLIRTYYEKGKGSGAKSATHVKLYETHHIRQRHGLGKLDKHGMVLIALLSGGDYDQTGIKGCGPRMALEAVQNGLAEPFKYSYFQRTEIHQWQAQMIGFLSRKAVEIPPIFPNQKALNYYRNPTVSTDSALLDLAQRWLIPQINEANLRLLLRSRFNIQTKAYIQHIIPIWVTKALREKLFDSHHSHGIELVSAGGRKKTEKVEQQYEQKIKYHPVAFTTLDLSVAPQGEFGEDWKPGFDAREITDCEVLEVLLQHGAPEACHKANEQVAKKKQSSTRKRKSKSDEDIATSNSSPKRQKGDNLATSGKSNISGCYKHQSKDTVQKNTKSGITVSRFRPPPPLSLNMIENDDSVNQSEQDFDSEHNSSFPQCVGAGNLSNPIVIDLTDD